MTKDSSRLQEDIVRYVNTYLARELIQPAEDANADPQLATLITILVERLSNRSSGSIIDIGCGHGVLLRRLHEIREFKEQPDWVYFAIDEDAKLDELARIARQLGVSRRVQPITLDEFYKNWPHAPAPQLVFCRNVFHELTIDQTAQLLHHVATHFSADDEFIVQDLLRLPESERHHACWLAEKLSTCIEDYGFERVTTVTQGSRSGNAWFNIIARLRTKPVPSPLASRSRLIAARQEQCDLWTALDQTHESSLPARPEIIAALDLDLQLASLTRELRNAGGLQLVLDERIARRVRTAEFFQRVDAFVRAGNLEKQFPAETAHFRERGEQLNAMEAFLRSQSQLALVYGGRGTGKTTFVNHLLKGRMYDKSFVSIDARVARGFLPIVEQLFAQVGLNLAADMLSVLGNIEYSNLESSIRQFLNKFAPRLIVVIENLDELVDSNGHLIDQDLTRLLKLVVSKESLKVIVTSRYEYLPGEFLAATGSKVPTSVRMGRFATDQTVINILDDHFDRGRAGIEDYPQRLIHAIDRHPLIAFLVGQILAKHGPSVLIDAQFVSEVQRQLRLELISRLVDDQAFSAVLAASNLRIAVPMSMLEHVASIESIYRARSSEVLYTVPDRRWNELIASLGLFRTRTLDDMIPPARSDREESVDHVKIADAYFGIYKIDDYPKWIRKSYFHRMLSGVISSSNLPLYAEKYYVPELISSAHYCYRTKRDFALALELYDAARTLTSLPEQALMWRASCMLRTRRRREGEEEYKRLVALSE